MLDKTFGNKKIPLLIGGAVLIILFGLVLMFFFTHSRYDQQGVNLTNFQAATSLDAEQMNIPAVTQIFRAENDNLNFLSLAVKNPHQPNIIKLSLTSGPGQNPVARQTITVPVSDEIQYPSLKITPLPDSRGKTYQLTVDLSESQDLELFTVAKDRYPDGQLLLGSLPAEQILVFNFHYYTTNPIQIILARLPFYKPWFFQYSISFIILFIVYFIFLAWLFFFFAKKLLTEN